MATAVKSPTVVTPEPCHSKPVIPPKPLRVSPSGSDRSTSSKRSRVSSPSDKPPPPPTQPAHLTQALVLAEEARARNASNIPASRQEETSDTLEKSTDAGEGPSGVKVKRTQSVDPKSGRPAGIGLRRHNSNAERKLSTSDPETSGTSRIGQTSPTRVRFVTEKLNQARECICVPLAAFVVKTKVEGTAFVEKGTRKLLGKVPQLPPKKTKKRAPALPPSPEGSVDVAYRPAVPPRPVLQQILAGIASGQEGVWQKLENVKYIDEEVSTEDSTDYTDVDWGQAINCEPGEENIVYYTYIEEAPNEKVVFYHRVRRSDVCSSSDDEMDNGLADSLHVAKMENMNIEVEPTETAGVFTVSVSEPKSDTERTAMSDNNEILKQIDSETVKRVESETLKQIDTEGIEEVAGDASLILNGTPIDGVVYENTSPLKPPRRRSLQSQDRSESPLKVESLQAHPKVPQYASVQKGPPPPPPPELRLMRRAEASCESPPNLNEGYYDLDVQPAGKPKQKPQRPPLPSKKPPSRPAPPVPPKTYMSLKFPPTQKDVTDLEKQKEADSDSTVTDIVGAEENRPETREEIEVEVQIECAPSHASASSESRVVHTTFELSPSSESTAAQGNADRTALSESPAGINGESIITESAMMDAVMDDASERRSNWADSEMSEDKRLWDARSVSIPLSFTSESGFISSPTPPPRHRKKRFRSADGPERQSPLSETQARRSKSCSEADVRNRSETPSSTAHSSRLSTMTRDASTNTRPERPPKPVLKPKPNRPPKPTSTTLKKLAATKESRAEADVISGSSSVEGSPNLSRMRERPLPAPPAPPRHRHLTPRGTESASPIPTAVNPISSSFPLEFLSKLSEIEAGRLNLSELNVQKINVSEIEASLIRVSGLEVGQIIPLAFVPSRPGDSGGPGNGGSGTKKEEEKSNGRMDESSNAETKSSQDNDSVQQSMSGGTKDGTSLMSSNSNVDVVDKEGNVKNTDKSAEEKETTPGRDDKAKTSKDKDKKDNDKDKKGDDKDKKGEGGDKKGDGDGNSEAQGGGESRDGGNYEGDRQNGGGREDDSQPPEWWKDASAPDGSSQQPPDSTMTGKIDSCILKESVERRSVSPKKPPKVIDRLIMTPGAITGGIGSSVFYTNEDADGEGLCPSPTLSRKSASSGDGKKRRDRKSSKSSWYDEGDVSGQSGDVDTSDGRAEGGDGSPRVSIHEDKERLGVSDSDLEGKSEVRRHIASIFSSLGPRDRKKRLHTREGSPSSSSTTDAEHDEGRRNGPPVRTRSLSSGCVHCSPRGLKPEPQWTRLDPNANYCEDEESGEACSAGRCGSPQSDKSDSDKKKDSAPQASNINVPNSIENSVQVCFLSNTEELLVPENVNKLNGICSSPKVILRKNSNRRISDPVINHRRQTASSLLSIPTSEDSWYNCTSGDESDSETTFLTSQSCFEDQLLSDASEHRKSKKYCIARELMTSEQVFVDVLKLLNEDFRAVVFHANNRNGQKVIPEMVLDHILRYLPQLQNLNQDLLKDLTERIERWDEVGRISDVIVKKGPFLKLYSAYIKDFESMTAALDDACRKFPGFAQVVKEFETSERCRKLGLKHYMLKPVQRIPQYKLLLEDYLKHLSVDSSDYEDTVTALGIVSDVANHANQTMKQGDNFSKLLQVQNNLIGSYEIIRPGRIFLKEGELHKLSRKVMQPRWFILFNDSLLHTDAVQGSFRLHHELPLAGMKVTLPTNEEYQNEFSIISVTRSFILSASSPQERDQWILALNSAIESNAARRGTFINASDKQKVPHKDVLPCVLGKAAPVWIPDGRVTMCQVCTCEFTVTFRRHHCRACGKVVCSNCSANRAPLQYLKFQSARVCDGCFSKLSEEFDATELTPGESDCSTEHASASETKDVASDGSNSSSRANLRAQFKRGGVLKKAKRHLPRVLKEVCANQQGATISGYLNKRVKKSWRRFWFVIHDKVLYTYKASEDVAALESIPLLSFQVQSAVETYENVDSQCVFQLVHPGRSPIIFYAESILLAEKWKKAMHSATVLDESSPEPSVVL